MSLNDSEQRILLLAIKMTADEDYFDDSIDAICKQELLNFLLDEQDILEAAFYPRYRDAVAYALLVFIESTIESTKDRDQQIAQGILKLFTPRAGEVVQFRPRPR